MKNCFRLLVIIGPISCILAFCPGCGDQDEQGNRPGVEAAEISGDATLTIENPFMDDRYTVYFDGVYIGSIRPDRSRTWSIPSGEHTILVDNGERDHTPAYTATLNFKPGTVVILRIGDNFLTN